MKREEIIVILRGILREYTYFPTERIEENTLLWEDLNMDSLDVVTAIVAVEDALGVSVVDEEIAKLHTIGDVADYILDMFDTMSNTTDDVAAWTRPSEYER